MKKKDKLVMAALILIFLFGFWLRGKSLTSFFLYPDSYHYLWQAENILSLQQPVATETVIHLGYSFLVALTGLFVKDLETAAHLVSFGSGLLAIPLVYLNGKNFFRSSAAGLWASLFLAGSFNHATWSGFVAAETPAIFFLLLGWALLWRKKWFLAGLIQAISIGCRIEYLLLVPPSWVFFFLFKKRWAEGFFYFFGLSLPFLILAPTANLGSFLWEKLRLYFRAVVACLVLAYCLAKAESPRLRQLAKIIPPGLLGFLAYSILLVPTRNLGKPLAWDLEPLKGWGDFALSDPLLVLWGLTGLGLMFKNYWRLTLFFLVSTLPIFLAYQRTNPLAHRYLVHLVPILAMSSGFLATKLWGIARLAVREIKPLVVYPAFFLVISLLVLGLFLPVRLASAQWHPEDNYEKLSAWRVRQIVEQDKLQKEAILITFSEAPYAFYTQLPVKEVRKTFPYFSLEGTAPSVKMVLVVVDEAVRDQRPEFAQWAEKNLRPFLLESIIIPVPYFYRDYHYLPEKPVEVYLLPIDKLKTL